MKDQPERTTNILPLQRYLACKISNNGIFLYLQTSDFVLQGQQGTPHLAEGKTRNILAFSINSMNPALSCQVLTHYLLPAVVVAVAINVPRFLETIQSEGARHSNNTGAVFKVCGN